MSLSSQKLKWILIGLLLISLVMPAMASDYSGSFTRADSVVPLLYTLATDGTGAQPSVVKSFYFDKIEDFQTVIGIFSSWAYTSYTWDYSVQSYSTTVDAYAGTTYIGSGLFGFNNNSATGYVDLYFYPTVWNTGALTGHQWVNFTDPSDPVNFPTHGLKDLTHSGQHKNVIGWSPVYAGGWTNIDDIGTGYIGYYIVNSQFKFENDWELTKTGSVIRGRVYKTIGGIPYKSKASLYQTDDIIIMSDLSESFNDFDQNTITTPVKIAVLDSKGNWYNSSFYYSAGTGYSISVSPTNITPAQNTTGTLGVALGTLADVTGISWEWSDSTGDHNFPDGIGTGNITGYAKKSTYWWGWNLSANDYTVNKGTSIPNPLTLFGSGLSTGIKTIKCIVFTSDGNYYTLTASLTVGGAEGYVPTYAGAVDYSTGAFVSDATIGFRNVATGVWFSNVTVGGQNSINSPPGIYLDIQATAPGYAPVTRYSVTASQINQSPMYYELGMFPVSAITGANQTTFYVSVYDQNSGWALANAYVSVINASFQWAHYTGTNGIATFTVYNNTLYQVTATKAGYTPLTKFVTVLSGTVATTEMRLSPISTVIPTRPPDTTIPTPTTPIPGWTPATGGGGNFTGFWSPFQNALVASGCAPAAAGGILALFISMICLIIGFQAGGLPGGEMGAILGVGYSVAAGFFPLAIAIIVVVGLIAYVSLRFWGMTH